MSITVVMCLLFIFPVFGGCNVEFGSECAAEIAWCLKTAYGLYFTHRHITVSQEVFCTCKLALAYVVRGVGTGNAVYLSV